MASSGQEKGSVPEYDECPVCRECLRDPRTLNCGHYFCRACIEGLVRENPQDSIKCPTCREVTRLPEESGVTDLPRHEGKYSFQYQVAGFLSGANDNYTAVKRDCDICEKGGVLATEFCNHCMENMCIECTKNHQVKISSHTVVPLVDKLSCSLHPNCILNMHCQKCTVNVCIRCVLSEHATHETVDIEGVAKQSRQRLQDFEKTQSAIDDKSTLEHVMAALREARKLETEFTDSINNTRRLLKELEAKLDQVERDTKSKMAAEIKTLSLYETDIKDMIDSRKSLIDHATYLVEQASNPELVEREKDFPRPRVGYIQNIDNEIIKLPDLGNTKTICGRLERLIAGLPVEFRRWHIGKSKILEIADLQKQHTVDVGHTTYGVTMDTKRQRIVARTTDAAGPLKVYDYQGHIQKSLGAGVTGLVEGDDRGICMDTKRDIYMAPCQNTLVLVDRVGKLVKSIPVGSDNKGVAYHKEGDCYLVSDIAKQTVYLIDPISSQVTRQIGSKGSGPTQFKHPNNIHVGAVAGIGRPCIIVSDWANHCIKLYNISLAHIKTVGSQGSGDKELSCPRGVCTDAKGRVVVADLENTRVVSYWTDCEGREQWERLLGSNWGGNNPRSLAIASDNTVMAIVDSTLKTMFIYN